MSVKVSLMDNLNFAIEDFYFLLVPLHQKNGKKNIRDLGIPLTRYNFGYFFFTSFPSLNSEFGVSLVFSVEFQEHYRETQCRNLESLVGN